VPYIDFNTSVSLTPEQKIAFKTEMGKLITILPGKNEEGLMVAVADGRDMWRSGRNDEPCAFVEIRVFHESPMDAKKQYVAAVLKYIGETFGIPAARCYLNFTEFANWGSGGEYKG